MSLSEILLQLAEQGVKLNIDSEDPNQLRILAPQGVLNPELQQVLLEQKSAILSLLKDRKTETGINQLPEVVPCPQQNHQPFPLTDIQHAFWVGRSGVLELGSVSNHGYYEIEGDDLDLTRLDRALVRLIARHDMLRAVILSDGQQQILATVPDYEIKILDLSAETPKVIAQQLEEIRSCLSHQVLQADSWPLFEFRATLLPNQKVRLHISYDLLIFDAWSLFLLFDEWFKLYQQPEYVLPPLELTFRDYVMGEQGLPQTELYQRSQDYWLARLDNLFPAPDLPLVKNPQELEDYRCRRYESRLEPVNWQQLQQRGKKAGLSPSGVLLAAFTEILTLWSHNPQFTVNLALFNRLPLHPQVNQILGNFTSVTLLTVDNSAKESFSDRARRIQGQLWQDLEHRYFNGVEVTRALNHRQHSTPKAMPVVFTSTLGLEALGQETATFNHFGELVYASAQASQAWMDIQVWQEHGALTFNWDVVEELFPKGLIESMFQSYCQLLNQLATEEAAWSETSRQLLPTDRLATINRLNATAFPIADKLLHSLFIDRVKNQGQDLAVIAGEHTFTYQELSYRVNQLGWCLREMGAKPNQLIGVMMEKGWEQIVAVMGILASGAAYVPIDPGLPKKRRGYILKNSGVKIVLTQSWLERQLALPPEMNSINVDYQDGKNSNNQHLEPVQTPEDLAYLIYTSGSTGTPKGVRIDHRGAVNTILDINQRFGINQSDRLLALSSLSFDLSVYDIFGTLAAGGTIVVPQASRSKDPSHWLELISQHQISIWNSVPALMQMMVDYGGDEAQVLTSLRLVLLSGDGIPLNLPTKIKSLVSDIQVISLGGATEASIWSIFYSIEKVESTWNSIPYGRPLANQRFYVFNHILEPCPTWVIGQLYIGGVGLAQGYWRDEAKTAASFINHPDTGERLYRTGDLGRYLPDSNIEFLGREDFQVKINGHRIELGEIETLLEQYPGIEQALVIVVGKQPQDKRLVAYIVALQSIDDSELRGFLGDRLPDYMLPSAFIMLDQLPLSANGKIDRKALPLPENFFSELTVNYLAPQNELEQTISNIWQEVLSLEKVGVNHNFFEAGGNSLLITSVYSQIKNILPNYIEYISLFDLFKYPSIRELATYLSLSQKKDFNYSLDTKVDLTKKLDRAKMRVRQKLQKSRTIRANK
ncbi:Amino acid adenylation enzyme/thioester reductase family protein [Hyella patelloides LEGE 07179]|uniref:Amino acid adenylation enzyme/thioester reductase family protein n=1 Tax=Hyella patelloides LEGE 07179 TaxID=945734 RepID=A0A563W1I7_9CYAN|nr:non-ribosomal peptide synthetase [Hyella patelloides]VEP17558.1 Amino acid adenylation enzyme/thioester reductase family protein [Hyella patelloides LEGE 07179]